MICSTNCAKAATSGASTSAHARRQASSRSVPIQPAISRISGTRPEKESLHHFPSKRGSRRSRAPRHAKELIGVRKPKLGDSCQTPDIDDRAAVTPQQKKRGIKPKPVAIGRASCRERAGQYV